MNPRYHSGAAKAAYGFLALNAVVLVVGHAPPLVWVYFVIACVGVWVAGVYEQAALVARVLTPKLQLQVNDAIHRLSVELDRLEKL